MTKVLHMDFETVRGTEIERVDVGDNCVELHLTRQGALRLAALADELRDEVNQERAFLRAQRQAAGWP